MVFQVSHETNEQVDDVAPPYPQWGDQWTSGPVVSEISLKTEEQTDSLAPPPPPPGTNQCNAANAGTQWKDVKCCVKIRPMVSLVKPRLQVYSLFEWHVVLV